MKREKLSPEERADIKKGNSSLWQLIKKVYNKGAVIEVEGELQKKFSQIQVLPKT